VKRLSNLDLWQEHGGNLLVVQPFMDSVIVRGEGCYLIDADERRILDLAAGQFCSILGHNNRTFIETLQRQLESGIHLGDQYVSPNVLRAAARLASVTPGALSKVLFLSTGSEANECAMRIAKTVTGRTGMLAYSRGYYGISLATRTLSSISEHSGKVDFEPAPVNQHKLITPSCRRCPIGLEHPSCRLACLGVSLDMVGDQLKNVAAIIVETVVSAGGMIFPPKDFLQALYAEAHRMGAIFIVDEAQTGFGRCGRWFDIEHYDIVPDILVVSKTAGNGYPAAAVVVSDGIANALENSGFTHLSSHQNDPLAAAAVHAVIDLVEQEGLVQHSADVGAYFVEQLRGLQGRHPVIADVRGRGLMIGMELSDEYVRQCPDLAFQLTMLCEQRGVHVTFTYYEPVIRFIPPLIISKDEIDMAVGILDEVLGVLEKGKANPRDLSPRNLRSGPFVRRMTSTGFHPIRMARKMWNTSPQQWAARLRASLPK